MFKELVEKTKQFLFARQTAYNAVFRGAHGERVLADLAKFCRSTKSTFHADARMHAVLEGRREVFLRIQQHVNLTQEELWSLMGRPDLDE